MSLGSNARKVEQVSVEGGGVRVIRVNGSHSPSVQQQRRPTEDDESISPTKGVVISERPSPFAAAAESASRSASSPAPSPFNFAQPPAQQSPFTSVGQSFSQAAGEHCI